MKLIHRIEEMRAWVEQQKITQQKIGLVPTMGYLHEGHCSLIKKAKEQCNQTVLSIFVNPLQFGPNEDYERYPRDPQRDLNIAKQEGVDLVFMPEVNEMYPRQVKTSVVVKQLTDVLCGRSRPGHFDGVATVVSKLFHIIEPDKAFFGLKDAQQLAVIEQMVNDLNMNVQIVPCPIIREADGLALSSRNKYLSVEERKQAVVLHHALETCGNLVEHAASSEMTISDVKQKMLEMIATAPLATVDYIECLTYPSLGEIDADSKLSEIKDSWIAALAVYFGKTRLIDNRLFNR